jgi:hypothetical protein
MFAMNETPSSPPNPVQGITKKTRLMIQFALLVIGFGLVYIIPDISFEKKIFGYIFVPVYVFFLAFRDAEKI